MPKRRHPEEQWAQAMIAHELGRPVECHDDGSADAMCDLLIRYEEARVAAVEVTAAGDSDAIEGWNAMNGRGETWSVEALDHAWIVGIPPGVRVNALRPHLPTLLRSWEAIGIRNWDLDNEQWVPGGNLAAKLGIAFAICGGEPSPGKIYLTIEQSPDQTGGFVQGHGNALAAWASEYLRSPKSQDVLQKLARSGAPERHAFLFVPGFSVAPFAVQELLTREIPPLPDLPPDLPDEVTHVWIASTRRQGIGLWWSSDRGWRRFDKLQAATLS